MNTFQQETTMKKIFKFIGILFGLAFLAVLSMVALMP